MTTYSTPHHTGPRRNAATAVATAAVAYAGALTAIGTFKGDNHSTGEWLIVLPVIAVGALVVFAGVVAPAARRGEQRMSRTALVLSVVGFLTLVAFWTGLPPVLAGGGGYLAITAARREERWRLPSVIAAGVSAFTLVAAAVLAVVG